MIEGRLKKEDSELADIIEELKQQDKKALNTALGAFYIKATAEAKEGGVEFYHKSFSEFLTAKRLLRSLEEWTERGGRRKQYLVDDEKLASQVYDLLGYGGLTWEIVEYLRGLIEQSKELAIVHLFERLYNFYLRWCEGEFIDADGTTLPQTKMRELKPFLAPETNLGQRQVDVYAGLNIMILLLELHRYGQSQNDEKLKQQLNFHPCGEVKENGEPVDKYLLFRLIGYTRCVETFAFRNIVKRFLDGTNLIRAYLYGVNFDGASLIGANLIGANMVRIYLDGANLKESNLSEANLKESNLVGINLKGANLKGADLEDADLDGANLKESNLRNANLTGANLKGSKLEDAYLEGANLEGANLEDAKLGGAKLGGAKLGGAYLGGAKLGGAYLKDAYLGGANLEDAYLEDAYLSGAKLGGAKLGGANLKGANLDSANLKGANLKGANLDGSNLDSANLKNISWDDYTNWNNVQGLEEAINVPEELKQQLGI